MRRVTCPGDAHVVVHNERVAPTRREQVTVPRERRDPRAVAVHAAHLPLLLDIPQLHLHTHGTRTAHAWRTHGVPQMPWGTQMRGVCSACAMRVQCVCSACVVRMQCACSSPRRRRTLWSEVPTAKRLDEGPACCAHASEVTCVSGAVSHSLCTEVSAAFHR